MTGKYLNPEDSVEWLDMSDEMVDPDKPYDSMVLRKLESRNEWLQRNRPAVSGQLRGGSGHLLSGSTSRVHERAFTSTNSMSSFLQIPYYRNVGMMGVRVFLYCRIGNSSVEEEAGIYPSANPFVQARFSGDLDKKHWSFAGAIDGYGIKNLNEDNIKYNEWQWIEFDYLTQPDFGADPEDVLGLEVGKWDCLQIGFGNRFYMDTADEYGESTSFTRIATGQNWVIGNNAGVFSYDTVASSPEITSWQLKCIRPVSEEATSSAFYESKGTLFDAAGTVVQQTGITSYKYNLMALWPSTSDSPGLPETKYPVGISFPSTHIQVRAVQIQDISMDAPQFDEDGSYESLKPTHNAAPSNLQSKISIIRDRKVCIVPFSKGHKPRSTATKHAGKEWNDREQYLRHNVLKGDEASTIMFDEIGSPSTSITSVEFAIIHTGFFNDMSPVEYNIFHARGNLAYSTQNIPDVAKSSADFLNTGVRGKVTFTVTAQQYDNGPVDSWITVGSKTINKDTKFMVINNDNITWTSQHIFANQMMAQGDIEWKQGFCYREGMMTMPDYGGNQGANDNYLLIANENRTTVKVDLGSNYDPRKPIRFRVSAEIDADTLIQGDDEIFYQQWLAPEVPQPEDSRTFLNIVGCSVWGQ